MIEMLNISKQFNGQAVLRNANFSIRSGEVCSLLGENGAGKTTLMKILAGVYSQDSGEILFEGKKVTLGSIPASQKLGIHMIFQESQLINFFSTEKNIFLGKEICFKHTPFINRKYQIEKARNLLEYLQIHINVHTPVKELSFTQKKMVEIAKALLSDVKVLIFDEATAPLSEPEIQKVFEIIEKLKKTGIAIVYISHKLEEVLQISDRIVILRDGETVEDIPKNLGDINKLIEKMAGEDYVNRYPKSRAKKGRKTLELRNVSNKQNTVKNISIYVRSGEIIGIAGLQGAGKSNLAKLIVGMEMVSEGLLLINNKPSVLKNPHQAIKKGIAYFSKYNEFNINMLMNTHYNITLSNLKRVTRFFIISRNLVDHVTNYFIKHLNLRIPDSNLPAKYLSRGTQQKVAISKWLHADASILIMDEPSIHLDINSKVELYNIMNKLSHNGKSILIASSDLRELIGMCDRIYIMFNGKIVAELSAEEANSIRILQFAFGNSPKSIF
ncbi:MAG: sugar ABC transporter ATP-binding protein [Eubacteriales bacterium]|nr:sugar ABC transporter ATP-binding protein [Eubacteriales bacterium]